MTGYNVSQTMVHVLKKCGDDLTRANIMRQAANIEKFLSWEGSCPASRSTPTRLTSLRSSNFSSGNSRASVGNCSAMSSVVNSGDRHDAQWTSAGATLPDDRSSHSRIGRSCFSISAQPIRMTRCDQNSTRGSKVSRTRRANRAVTPGMASTWKPSGIWRRADTGSY